MRKSERNARLRYKGSGHAVILPVGSVGSLGWPAPHCCWEQSSRHSSSSWSGWHGGPACTDGRARSRFLWDTSNSGLLSPALPSGDSGLGDRALQMPQALLLYRKELCASVQDIGTVILGAVKEIRRACDVGQRFLLQPLWRVNCC